MQTSISSRRAIRTCASFNKTLGRRYQSLWLSIQELKKQSCQWIESGSRANDFYTTADGSKVYNEGQRKLDVRTLDGQQRRSMTFHVARVKKALGSSSQMVKNGNKLVFDQDSSGKDTS